MSDTGSYTEAGSYTEGEPCEPCEWRKNNECPIWGHFQCSHHRPCSTEQGWTPVECNICLHMRHLMKTMDLTNRKKSLYQLLEMLRCSQAKFKNMGSIQPDKIWEFEQEVKFFLGDFHELKIHEIL